MNCERKVNYIVQKLSINCERKVNYIAQKLRINCERKVNYIVDHAANFKQQIVSCRVKCLNSERNLLTICCLKLYNN